MQHQPPIIATILITTLLTVVVTLSFVLVGARYFPSEIRALITPAPDDTESITPPTIMDAATVPDVVAEASPAVVSVVISAEVPIIERYFEEYNPFGGFFGGFQVPRERQIGTEERQIGGGSGFFVSPDGYLVTNRHVVDIDGATFSIVTDAGETYPVEVIAKDPSLDIAILKAAREEAFPYLPLGDSDTLRLGETVIAIGNALAEFANSVSVGVVSGLSRDIVAGDRTGTIEALEGVIQTDAAINRGNSGGPLIDLSGTVIGVNVAVAQGSENIGFALPIDTVKRVYESVREHGEIIRPFLGIRYLQITESLAAQNDLPVDYGILIIRGETTADLAVIPDSPAGRAGLTENDIILSIDGIRLDGERSFANILRNYAPGDTVTLTVLDADEERTVSATLDRAPNE